MSKAEKPCPRCGHCPTCGRPTSVPTYWPAPWPWWPTYPPYPHTPYPYRLVPYWSNTTASDSSSWTTTTGTSPVFGTVSSAQSS